MKLKAIGFDLAKSLFQVHGIDDQDRPVLRRQLRRDQVLEFFARLERCLVGMEACASAHHWGRKLAALGHTVRLIAPKYVKAYVKTNKNDARDAEAICEALLRPSMRFVALKSAEQQGLLALHRLRQGLIDARTALVNQLRGLLGETARQGFAQLKGVVAPDTWGIAVPVLNRRQRAVASLGVVVPLQEMSLQALVPALQTAARGIARQLTED